MKELFLILVLFLCVNVSAKTILISDVDDTIKNSQVRHYSQALRNLFKVDKSVLVEDMNHSYKKIVEGLSVEKVFYVSKAPAFLEDLHRDFLRNNEFPKGKLYSRGWKLDFKFWQISNIINSYKPTEVLLVGDNGEEDPSTFHRLVRAYEGRGVQFEVYIRKAYDSGQVYPEAQEFFNEKDLLQVMGL